MADISVLDAVAAEQIAASARGERPSNLVVDGYWMIDSKPSVVVREQ